MSVAVDYETFAILMEAASNWGDYLEDLDREEDLLTLDAALLLAGKAEADALAVLVAERDA